jgi:hypothetical protein
MPAYIFRLSGEINVAKTLDEQAADIAKVKALVDAVKVQAFSPDALTALVSATNLSIDVKMVGRSAKAKSDEAAG